MVQFARVATEAELEDQSPGGPVSTLIAESPSDWWSLPERSDSPEMTTLRRGYHGVSRGLILNQLLQRVDPAGRTVGQFLRDEIAAPLGLEDSCLLGIPEATQASGSPHIANMVSGNMAANDDNEIIVSDQAKPWAKEDPEAAVYFTELMQLHLGTGFRAITRIMAAENGEQNSVFSRKIESPSSNGHSNARALAKIAAAMAGKGALGGVRLMSEETWEAAHSGATQKFDDVLLSESR